MRVSLLLVRYNWWAVPFALLSMVLFRFPLWASRSISFWQLLGCGKNGSFDITPDLQQWGIITVHPAAPSTDVYDLLPAFINRYLRIFSSGSTHFILEPIEGHGLWNGREVFGKLPKQTDYEGKIAVLTRATIRLSQTVSFWRNVPPVSTEMKNAKGLIQSYGIGEVPLVKQATFSIWQSKQAMKEFAYGRKQHQQVIRDTRSQKWYAEEMFVRFKVLEQIDK